MQFLHHAVKQQSAANHIDQARDAGAEFVYVAVDLVVNQGIILPTHLGQAMLHYDQQGKDIWAQADGQSPTHLPRPQHPLQQPLPA